MIMLQPELNVLLISMDVTFFGMSRFQQDKVRLAAIKITHFYQYATQFFPIAYTIPSSSYPISFQPFLVDYIHISTKILQFYHF